ncbi:MAG: amidase [Candidatus Nanopelagicales bacterium]
MADAFKTYRDDALGTLDAIGVAEAISTGKISAEEARDAAMERSAQARAPLNAVASLADSPAIGTGVFGGVPTFVKDNEDVVGLPTSHGSRATSRTPKTAPSAFVSHFEQLGFTVLGKSTLPEFGLTATCETLAFGPTRNPWNLDHSTGGSSGGAASLVAAGVVPIAHANDGGGSIRIPASCCGLVGLKPSRGRLVARPELEKLPVQITAQGVVTRSVRDSARFYGEADRIHGELPPIGDITGPSAKRLRIAVVEDGMDGLPVDPQVREAVNRTVDLLAHAGHQIEYVPFPFDLQFGKDFLRYWAALAFAIQVGGKSAFDPEFDKTKLEPFANNLAGLVKGFAVRLPATLRRLKQFPEVYETKFVDYDAMISPVLSHPPPPIGYLGPDVDPHDHMVRLLRYASFTAVQNVSGAPAISLPMSVSREGVPIGVQISGPFAREATLIELAYEIEEATADSRSLDSAGWLPTI